MSSWLSPILLPSMPQGVIALIAATAVGTAFPVNLLLSTDALAAQLAFGAHTVGFPPPLVTLSVRRPDGSEIGPGETGEVHARGPNVFAGYRTRAGVAGIPEDGWVASGDLGQLTEDGQLRLLGRRKDIIIRSGHNIDPAMIEEVAYAHPDVRQAGAVPMPDAYAGELPVLYVAVRTGAHISPEAICDFVAERIAEPPARPKRVFILPELPLTPAVLAPLGLSIE